MAAKGTKGGAVPSGSLGSSAHVALLMEAKEAFAFLDRNKDGKLSFPVCSHGETPLLFF